MRVLVITRSAWDESNSFGNTMTNIWSGWKSADIANLYFRDSPPANEVCHSYFSISDISLLRTLVGRQRWAGTAFTLEAGQRDGSGEGHSAELEDRVFRTLRGTGSGTLKWAQELLWIIGRWKSPQFRAFLSEFKPDVIFSPAFGVLYTHRVLWWIAKQTGAKVVLFHADDYLSTPKFGSPLNRLYGRSRKQCVLSSARKADLNFTISPKMRAEYESIIGKAPHLLYKGADFSNPPPERDHPEGTPLRLIYAGSLLSGRWRTLAAVAQAIKELNHDRQRLDLTIYSQYTPSDEIAGTLNVPGASRFLGRLNSGDVMNALRDSDVALHVESFEESDRLATRLSFSTKIVDCLNSGRCVLAIGWSEAASIQYLSESGGALVATSETQISEVLRALAEDPALASRQAIMSWQVGASNHDYDILKARLAQTLEDLSCDDVGE